MPTKQHDDSSERPTANLCPDGTNAAPTVHSDRLVDIKEVESLIGVGPSSIWAWTRDGRFVQPVRLSARCTRWKLSQIHSWIASQGEAA